MMSDLYLSQEQISISTAKSSSQRNSLSNLFAVLQLLLGTGVNAAAIANYEWMPQLSIAVLLIGCSLLVSGVKNFGHSSFLKNQ